MERYIIFVRKVESGEEFVSARMGSAGQHEQVMAEARRKYPQPTYQVHTTYTQQELQDVLESMNRWCGPAQKEQQKTNTPIKQSANKAQALIEAMRKSSLEKSGLQEAVIASQATEASVQVQQATVQEPSVEEKPSSHFQGVTWG